MPDDDANNPNVRRSVVRHGREIGVDRPKIKSTVASISVVPKYSEEIAIDVRNNQVAIGGLCKRFIGNNITRIDVR